MKKEITSTDLLLQKIIDRQMELTVLSSTILKNKSKKEIKANYNWFEQIKSRNNLFNLSKAV
jgi:hypothetical protein